MTPWAAVTPEKRRSRCSPDGHRQRRKPSPWQRSAGIRCSAITSSTPRSRCAKPSPSPARPDHSRPAAAPCPRIGFALAKLGQVDEGVDALRESLAIAERYGTADDISRADVNLSATLTVAIRCNEAADVARDGLEHARRAGMLASDGVLLTYNRAEALYLLGSWDAAAELIMAGPITTERPHGSLGAVLVCRLAFHRGHSGRAAEYRDLALALLDKGKGAARAPKR